MLRATTSRLARSATRPFAETTAGGAGSHDLKCPVSGNNGPRLGRLPSRGLTHSDMANTVGGRHFPKLRRFKQESDCGDWIPEIRLGGFGCDAKVRSARIQSSTDADHAATVSESTQKLWSACS